MASFVQTVLPDHDSVPPSNETKDLFTSPFSYRSIHLLGRPCTMSLSASTLSARHLLCQCCSFGATGTGWHDGCLNNQFFQPGIPLNNVPRQSANGPITTSGHVLPNSEIQVIPKTTSRRWRIRLGNSNVGMTNVFIPYLRRDPAYAHPSIEVASNKGYRQRQSPGLHSSAVLHVLPWLHIYYLWPSQTQSHRSDYQYVFESKA
jgi:hypothetical protein